MIACLAWGSLVWEPRTLPIKPIWFPNGPAVPVEFARRADDGTIAVVLCEHGARVPCLWAEMTVATLDDAAESLAVREKTPRAFGVGQWRMGDADPALLEGLSAWAHAAGAGGVVWTALGPRLHGDVFMPTQRDVVEYLAALEGDVRKAAEIYIRRAPAQIETPYRREIEEVLGWVPDTKG
jgi:hypothetical protein